MGSEAIGRGVGSVATGMGRGGGLGSMARVGAPGIEGGFSVSKISNPFNKGISQPISMGSYVENRPPSLFGPTVDVIKNPFRQPEIHSVPRRTIRPRVDYQPTLKVAEVIAQAEAIVARVQEKPTVLFTAPKRPAVLERRISPWVGSIVRMPEPATVRAPYPSVDPFISTKTEAKVMTSPKPAESPQPRKVASEPRVRSNPHPVESETVKKKKVTLVQEIENKKKEDKQKKNNQQVLNIVEHLRVSRKRRAELKRAVSVAFRKTRSLITGEAVAEEISKDFWFSNENKSGISEGEKEDHTIRLNLRSIKNDHRVFKTEDEAVNSYEEKYLRKYIPVEASESPTGRMATVEEVIYVLEGEGHKAIGNNVPAKLVLEREKKKEEVKTSEIRRVISITEGGQPELVSTSEVNSQSVTEEEEQPVVKETSLSDYPQLAEVFKGKLQKAA